MIEVGSTGDRDGVEGEGPASACGRSFGQVVAVESRFPTKSAYSAHQIMRSTMKLELTLNYVWKGGSKAG